MIGEVAAEPIPPAQPPWELWFLEGFEGSKVVAVLKMNHAMADGGTFARLARVADEHRAGRGPVAPAIPRPASALSRGDALRDGARELWQEYRRELPQRLRAIRQAHAKTRKTAAHGRPRPYSVRPRCRGAAH